MKISDEELIYLSSKHIAGELVILIQGINRVNHLIAEFRELPLTSLDKELENKVKNARQALEVSPIAGTLLVSASVANLNLLKKLKNI